MKVEIKIKISHTEVVLEVFVVENLSYDLIIGLPSLTLMGLSLDQGGISLTNITELYPLSLTIGFLKKIPIALKMKRKTRKLHRARTKDTYQELKNKSPSVPTFMLTLALMGKIH